MEKIYCVFRVRTTPYKSSYDLMRLCSSHDKAREKKKELIDIYGDKYKIEIIRRKVD